jgi:hypothetical protein
MSSNLLPVLFLPFWLARHLPFFKKLILGFRVSFLFLSYCSFSSFRYSSIEAKYFLPVFIFLGDISDMHEAY